MLLIRWRLEQSFHKSLHWTDISLSATERAEKDTKNWVKIHLDFERVNKPIWSDNYETMDASAHTTTDIPPKQLKWHRTKQTKIAQKCPRWTVYYVSGETIDVHKFITQSAAVGEIPRYEMCVPDYRGSLKTIIIIIKQKFECN